MVESNCEYVTCQICFKKFKALSAHLASVHGVRPENYKKAFKGELTSKRTKERMKSTQNPRNSGHKTSQATKDLISRRISESLRAKSRTGDKCSRWKGGCRVHMKYGTHWIDVSNAVRERDNFNCRLCGRVKPVNSRNFPVHHIDFNGRNNDMHNLITLCKKCHSKMHTVKIEKLLDGYDWEYEVKEIQKKLIALTYQNPS